LGEKYFVISNIANFVVLFENYSEAYGCHQNALKIEYRFKLCFWDFG
jgi:hypothetical protein